jgi:heme exporter protein B
LTAAVVRPASPRPPSFLGAAAAVFAKDLRIEWRTKEILTTAGFFALLVTVMASVAFLDGEHTAPGAIWIPIAFSGVLALGRTWQREREENALVGLLVAPIPRAALFLGKGAGVLLFLLAVEAVIVPTVALLFHLDLLAIAPRLLPLLLAGSIGIAGLGTLFGAMTVRTRARDLVLATVLFPLLSPVLLSGVAGTKELFDGATLRELSDYFLLLGVFDVLAVAGGIFLFGPLVDD